MILRRIYDYILLKFALINKKEHLQIITDRNKSINEHISDLHLGYDKRIQGKDGQIKVLEKENLDLRDRLQSFPKLLSGYNTNQINALYYEMISTVRNDPHKRHLFGIWFKRMINAVETLDFELMAQIIQENKLITIKEIGECKHNSERFSEKSMG